MRGVVGCVGHFSYITAIYLINISKASVLFWTNPMVVALIAFFYLNEKISRVEYLAIVLVFIGVVLTLDPFK